MSKSEVRSPKSDCRSLFFLRHSTFDIRHSTFTVSHFRFLGPSVSSSLGPRTPQVILALVGVLGALGCGYSHQELFPPEYETVAVPIFQNRSFYRDVETDLTEALIKQIELRTPYKVVAPARADTVIEGTIVSITQRLLSRGRGTGLPQELEVLIEVNLHWKDLRTGDLIRHREGFASVGRYIPRPPLLEPFQVAQHEAVQRLAREIVDLMEADW